MSENQKEIVAKTINEVFQSKLTPNDVLYQEVLKKINTVYHAQTKYELIPKDKEDEEETQLNREILASFYNYSNEANGHANADAQQPTEPQ